MNSDDMIADRRTDTWTTVAAWCGVAGGLAWLAKVATLLAQGGSSPVDVLLFAVGLLLLVVAATGIGAHLTRGRPVAARVAAIVLIPALALVAFGVVQTVTEPLGRFLPGSVDAEFGVVLAAALGIGLGMRRLMRSGAAAVTR